MFEPIHTTMMKGQVDGFETHLAIYLMQGLILIPLRASPGYGKLFILWSVHSRQSCVTGFLQSMEDASRGSLHFDCCALLD